MNETSSIKESTDSFVETAFPELMSVRTDFEYRLLCEIPFKCNKAVFSPNGQFLAMGDANMGGRNEKLEFIVYDILNSKVVFQSSDDFLTSRYSQFLFSSDGKRLFVCGFEMKHGDVRVIDTQNWETIRFFTIPMKFTGGHRDFSSASLAFVQNEKYLAVGAYERVFLIPITSLQKKTYSSWVEKSAEQDGIIVLDARKNKTRQGGSCVIAAYPANDRLLLMTGGPELIVWDTLTQKILSQTIVQNDPGWKESRSPTPNSFRNYAPKLSFSPDGKTFLAFSFSELVESVSGKSIPFANALRKIVQTGRVSHPFYSANGQEVWFFLDITKSDKFVNAPHVPDPAIDKKPDSGVGNTAILRYDIQSRQILPELVLFDREIGHELCISDDRKYIVTTPTDFHNPPTFVFQQLDKTPESKSLSLKELKYIPFSNVNEGPMILPSESANKSGVSDPFITTTALPAPEEQERKAVAKAEPNPVDEEKRTQNIKIFREAYENAKPNEPFWEWLMDSPYQGETDGKKYLIPTNMGLIRVFDLETGEETKPIDIEILVLPRSLERTFTFPQEGVLFSAGSFKAISRGYIKMFDPEREKYFNNPVDDFIACAYIPKLREVAYWRKSQDGKMLTLSFHDVDSEQLSEKRKWDVPFGDKYSDVKFSADGKLAAVVAGWFSMENRSLEYRLYVYDLQAGVNLWKTDVLPGSIDSFGFSPDGKLLAIKALSPQSRAYSIMEAATGTERFELNAYSYSNDSLFTPDSRYFVTMPQSASGLMEFWNTETGQKAGTMEYNFYSKTSPYSKQVTFSPDCSVVFVKKEFWDGTTGQYDNKILLLKTFLPAH